MPSFSEQRAGSSMYGHGLLYTFIQLCKNPGKALLDYLQGKRVRFFRPFAYVVILSTISALLLKFTVSCYTFSALFTDNYREKFSTRLLLEITLCCFLLGSAYAMVLSYSGVANRWF